MAKRMIVTLKVCEYKVETEEYWGRASDWKLATSVDGVEVWRETRPNNDRWYHAVCEDEAEGKKVMFDFVRLEEYRLGLPMFMLDKITELMQNELRPSGNHYVRVACGFDCFGLDGEFTVEEPQEQSIPIHHDDFTFNRCDDWTAAICRFNDVEKLKPLVLKNMMEYLQEKRDDKRKELNKIKRRIAALEELGKKELENEQAETKNS